MKKLISIPLLFILLLLLSLSMFSCKIGDDNNVTPPDGDSTNTDTVVYSTTVNPTIIYKNSDDRRLAEDIQHKIYQVAGITAALTDSGDDITGNEIIIGSTSRSISADALRRLTRICEKESEDTVGYLIYASDGNVAIVYNDEYVIDAAIEKFKSLITGETLKLANGVVAYDTLIVSEVKKALAYEKREQEFVELESVLGTETTDELRKIWSMFDERLYTWMANLWCPDNGGFYFSNSGRDTFGFLPDVESTAQIIRFLASCGMNEAYTQGNYDFIPDEMSEAIVKFIQGLQDPEDGYFYHPQWGKDITVSRRGRDLSWSTSLLKNFYAKPLYDTPDGMKGSTSGASGASYMTSPLSNSAVLAVSKITAVSSRLPEHLRSTAAFSEYLEALDMRGDSYYTGNLVGSQLGEVENAGQEYIDILINYLNRMQIPSTGLWEEGVSYNAVDGLMKMSGIYSRFKKEIPNAMNAAESTFTMIADPDIMTHVCSVYNPWYVLNALQESLRRVGSNELADAIRDRARAEAPELLSITYAKAVRHQLSDGSFFYQKNSESYTSQGALVGVPGILCGDVNATLIIANGMTSQICNSLGIDEIPLYYDYDYDQFVGLIENMGSIIKDEVPTPEPVNFNYDTDLPVDITYEEGSYPDAVNFSVKSVEKGNNALHITKTGESAEAGISMPLPGFAANKGNCYIFEADINYLSSGTPTDKTLAQIFFGGSATAYALNIYSSKDENGNPTVEIREHGPGDYTRRTLAKNLLMDKWFDLRVEYYYDAERAIIYIDGTPVAESALNWLTSTDPTITRLRYSLYRTIDSELMMDNLLFKCETKRYACFDPEVEASKPPEPIVAGPITFEGSLEIPGSVSYVAGDPSYTNYRVETEGSNNYLHSYQLKNASAVSYLAFPLADSFLANSNRYIFEADLQFNSENTDLNKTIAQIIFTGSASAFGLNVGSATDADGDPVIYIKEHSPNDWTLSRRTLVENIPMDSWFNLRVEYYYKEQRALIYINNTVVAESAMAWFDSVNPTITKINFSIYRTSTSDIYLDNINVSKDVAEYACFDESVTLPPTNSEIEPEPEPDAPPETEDVTTPASITGNRGSGVYYASSIKYGESPAPSVSGAAGATLVGDGDKYLYFYKAVSEGESNSRNNIIYNNAAAPGNARGLTLELDIAFGNFSDYTDADRIGTPGFQIALYDGAYQGTVYLYGDNGKISTKWSGIVAGTSLSLDEGTWYNLRFESYEYTAEVGTTRVIKVYVNGEYACDLQSADTGATAENNIRLILRQYDTNDWVAIDNVYIGYTTSDYVPGDPDAPESDDTTTDPIAPPEEKPSEEDKQEPIEALDSITGERGTGAYYNSSTKYGDVEAPAASSSSAATLLYGTDDPFVYFYKDLESAESNSQAHILYENNVSVPEGTPGRVIELDIAFGGFSNYTDASRVGTAGFQISFYGGAEQGTVYFKGDSGKISIANNTILSGDNISLDEGEWYNLRLECYDYTTADGADTKVIKLYVNGVWACDLQSADSGTSGAKNIRLTLRQFETDDWIAFDNVYTGYLSEAYVSDYTEA